MFAWLGFPIRKSPDQSPLDGSPKLIAVTPRPSSSFRVKASTIRPYYYFYDFLQDSISHFRYLTSRYQIVKKRSRETKNRVLRGPSNAEMLGFQPLFWRM